MVAVPGQASLLSLVFEEMLLEVAGMTVGGVTNITFVQIAPTTSTTTVAPVAWFCNEVQVANCPHILM